MPYIELPKLNVLNFSINEIYLSGDDVSVNQYCTENSLTLVSYDVETQRFSNHGALPYQYYDSNANEWKTEFGFRKIVTILRYDDATVMF